ncbi:MAG: hypothetical protein CVV14_10525 [Gammaproteobacteria bacterium HGW-Gammaproteobacteria-4]|jgi:uncharacterized RDD family membrane protein YckC|nr:MAG: hypothetical protein CVV14_10525 [Gammaproteobacteria bacterium HGW-Gammaproteobacteria-4]
MLTAMNRTPASPANMGWRLVAMIYDLLPLLALWFLTSGLLLLARGGTPVTPGSATAIAEFALLWLVTGAYATVSWRRGGQTIGMRPWRLRVVDAHGRDPSWRAVLLRYVLAGLSLAAFGLGFVWALFDPQRRTWHDLAAGTLMVRLARSDKR